MKRPPTFRPTYGLDGPHFPRTRAGWMRVLRIAETLIALFTFVACLAFTVGAMLRHGGLL